MKNKTDILGESDDDIIRQVMDGNIDAFEHLLVRYRDHVIGIVQKHVPYDQAEETAHMVFVRIYQSLGTYKKKGAFRQWLSSIAVRTCYDFWRERYRSKEYTMSSFTEHHQDWMEHAVSGTSQEVFFNERSRREARELLERAMAKLSPKDRIVIELVYLEELSIKEAAELLGWSAANVKIRSFRTRKKLRALLSEMMKR